MPTKPTANRKPAVALAGPVKAKSPRGGTTTPPTKAERVYKPAATYNLENDPTLHHPLQGRKVQCTVLGDPQSSHPKTKVVVGKLTAGGSVVIFIDYVGYWTSNVKDLKEKK